MEKLSEKTELRFFRRDEPPREGVVVVIDVYLATSNLVVFLEQAVEKLMIVNEGNWQLARRQFPKAWLVGESWQPLRFDLPNSLSQLNAANLSGQTIIYMSVNGTKALESLSVTGSQKILMASFLNLTATARYLQSHFPQERISFFAAGNQGEAALEDTRCAHLLKRLLLGETFDWPREREEVRISIQQRYSPRQEDVDLALSLDRSQVVPMARRRGGFWEVVGIGEDG